MPPSFATKRLYLAFALAFSFPALYLSTVPIVYAFVWSIAGTEVPDVLGQASVRWYREVWESTRWREGIVSSTLLAVGSASLSTTLAILLSYKARSDLRA